MTASPWQYFTMEELTCRCGCGRMEMDHDFMPKVVILRRELGFPFPVTSAFRCITHNQNVSSTGAKGPHPRGHGLDIGVSYGNAVRLLKAAIYSDMFTGIGINQKGDPENRFIHLDDLPEREAIWTY